MSIRRGVQIAAVALSTSALVGGCGGRAGEGAPAQGPGAGSGSVVGEDELDRQKGTRTVEELMEGRFAGVRVLRLPGGGIRVQIRGISSLRPDDQPLYVLDGLPLDPAPGGALLGINPADISRIEVLKDIGSTAFYGVRGANGVVLITTRRE